MPLPLWGYGVAVWEEYPDAVADLDFVIFGDCSVAVGYAVPAVCLHEAGHVVLRRYVYVVAVLQNLAVVAFGLVAVLVNDADEVPSWDGYDADRVWVAVRLAV